MGKGFGFLLLFFNADVNSRLIKHVRAELQYESQKAFTPQKN